VDKGKTKKKKKPIEQQAIFKRETDHEHSGKGESETNGGPEKSKARRCQSRCGSVEEGWATRERKKKNKR